MTMTEMSPEPNSVTLSKEEYRGLVRSRDSLHAFVFTIKNIAQPNMRSADELGRDIHRIYDLCNEVLSR